MFPFQYFVFDFHQAPAMLFDKIITLTVGIFEYLIKTECIKSLSHERGIIRR